MVWKFDTIQIWDRSCVREGVKIGVIACTFEYNIIQVNNRPFLWELIKIWICFSWNWFAASFCKMPRNIPGCYRVIDNTCEIWYFNVYYWEYFSSCWIIAPNNGAAQFGGSNLKIAIELRCRSDIPGSSPSVWDVNPYRLVIETLSTHFSSI